MKKTLIFIGIIILISGTIISIHKYSSNKELPYNFITVSKRDVIQEVSATGKVTPIQDVNLQFESPGKISNIFVKVGDKVQSGEPLMKLDTVKLEIQKKEAQANLKVAQAKLQKILAGATAQEIQLKKTAVANAQDNLLKIKDNAKTSIDLATDNLNSAKTNLANIKMQTSKNINDAYENAINILDDSQIKIYNSLMVIKDIQKRYFDNTDQWSISIRNKKIVSENCFANAESYLKTVKANPSQDNIDLALKKFKISAETTRDILNFIRKGLDDETINGSATDKAIIDTERINLNGGSIAQGVIPKIISIQQAISSTKLSANSSIDTAQAQVDSAKDSLDNLKTSTQSQIAQAEGALDIAQNSLELITASPKQTDIDLANAQIQQANAALLLIQNKIKNAVLLSPINSKIIEINGSVGEMTKPGVPSIKIEGANFQIETNIPEVDIAKIKIGNTVKIILDALPDEEYSGKVIKIDPGQKNIEGVVYYRVTIIFDNIDERIKTGMTTDLTIKTNNKKNVLAIPYRAIIDKNNKKIVRIVDENGKILEKEIKLGLRGSAGWVEIINGIEEGDRVVTFIKTND